MLEYDRSSNNYQRRQQRDRVERLERNMGRLDESPQDFMEAVRVYLHSALVSAQSGHVPSDTERKEDGFIQALLEDGLNRATARMRNALIENASRPGQEGTPGRSIRPDVTPGLKHPRGSDLYHHEPMHGGHSHEHGGMGPSHDHSHYHYGDNDHSHSNERRRMHKHDESLSTRG